MQPAFASETDANRREFERTKVSLFARCMLNGGLEIPCQVIDISPAGAGFASAHIPEVGENVIGYVDQIGRIEGPVVRVWQGGFAMTINGTPRKREKLEAQIAWVKQHDSFGAPDDRAHKRFEPQQKNSKIELPDGRTYPVELIDISLSGAAVKAGIRPAIGAKVSLGGMAGHVVRHFDEGLAIQFVNVATKSALGQITQ